MSHEVPVSHASQHFSCFLIGTESLLIACGEILFEEGHEVRGVISAEPSIARWAAEKRVRVIDPASDYFPVLEAQPFDYLLSITNLEILPDRVVSLPLRGAINCHDGPLPKYGGLFAPVWALIDQQASHGVTWHLMNSRADSGAIVEQRLFDISPRETSLTLNTKCYSAGIESFPAVVAAIRNNAPVTRAHELDRQTFHTRSQRPRGNCSIYWSNSAEEIAALGRALDFGSYPNAFGLPRLNIGTDAALVRRIDVSATQSGASPGTIIAIAADGITVATSDGDVVIGGMTTMSGVPVEPVELAMQHGLVVGGSFAELDVEAATRIDAATARIARHEPFWVTRLSSGESVELPYSLNDVTASPLYAHSEMPIEADHVAMATMLPGVSRTDFITCAFAAYIARLSGKNDFDIGFRDVRLAELATGNESWVTAVVPLRYSALSSSGTGDAIESVVRDLERVRQRVGFARDVVVRYPVLNGYTQAAIRITQGIHSSDKRDPFVLDVVISDDAGTVDWHYDATALSAEHVESMQQQFAVFLKNLGASWNLPLSNAPILTDAELEQIIQGWNATAVGTPAETCLHVLIEDQARRTPDAIAVAAGDGTLTYRELDSRANQLARYLRARGVGPDVLVGVCVTRSAGMMVALVAIHKAGGAYVPLDPAYPATRISFMLEDAQVSVLVAEERLLESLPESDAEIVCIDRDDEAIARESDSPIPSQASGDNLAYVIYTSGSTGTPKGVMVEHRNVVNFFHGMDDRIGSRDPGVWLAVTSLSFDISVLELFWTLARGFTVVIYAEPDRRADAPVSHPRSNRKIDFSLFYFSADEAEGHGEKYKLLLEGARYADRNGFTAVWTPERHFHAFGGLYPNPAVTGAAVAAITENVAIRAGSCVLPLHHPLRVAEEWSVVDNISNGRVGISFAAGWQPNDFVLRPENFADARNVMLREIETVRKLWRGESLTLAGPTGKDVTVSILPRPVQPELPFWLTTAGNPASFEAAGKVGANVLTHLLGQSVAELGEKLALYRKAWKAAGHAGKGHVSLMLHTFVGDDDASVKETVRRPMMEYLRTSISLIKPYASAFPTFRRSNPDGTKQELDFESLTPDEMESLLEYSFERYYETSGLFGTPESCARIVDELASIDVDEIACLIDFGVDSNLVLEHLAQLNVVRMQTEERFAATVDSSVPALIEKHKVTHMQCTPSMASMLLANEQTRDSFSALDTLMIGGEAFPQSLAEELQSVTRARILNMYGPTETTIWSTTHTLNGTRDGIPIGRPIANTELYIVDANGQPVPVGVPGELMIGGAGVVRGYLNRPELTAERFVDIPLGSDGRRVYRTGDLTRYRPDGSVEFLGRIDHQVKIRGYRIELGEIESALSRHPSVREAVVVAREDTPGDKRLVAYVVPKHGATDVAQALREHVRGVLPEHMVPSHFVLLSEIPRTPNAKIDRNSLPSPDTVAAKPAAAYVSPQNELEQVIAGIWQEVLKVPQVGTSDNFFDLGGHSLLAVQVHGRLRKVVPRELSITDLFRFPTIRALAGFLGQADSGDEALRKGFNRAEARRQSMTRRPQRR